MNKLQNGQPFNPWGMFLGVHVPNFIAREKRVTMGAKLTYGVLARYAGSGGRCFPGQATIAEYLGVSERQVRDYIRNLEALGWLRIVRDRGRGCGYEFIWWDSFCDSMRKNTPPNTGTLVPPNRFNNRFNEEIHLVGSGSERLTSEFDRWIKLYPNATRVDAAQQAWRRLVSSGEITEENIDEVFEGLERWKRSEQWAKEDGRYMESPLTFLTGNSNHRGRLWKDFPAESEEWQIKRRRVKSSEGIDPMAIWVLPWENEDK